MSDCRPSRGGVGRAVNESLAEIAQAVGHPHRLALLEHLAQGQRSVDELAGVTGLTFANTSRHLQILRRARVVQTERHGKHILYSLAGAAEVVALLTALRSLAERNRGEVQQLLRDYFSARDSLAPVTRAELVLQLKDNLVTVIDVRPADEFSLGHLPGARNVPLAELKKRLSRLPRTKEIVAYCRGPYCVLSVEAVELLRAKGYRARRLEDGFPEWRAAGLAVEVRGEGAAKAPPKGAPLASPRGGAAPRRGPAVRG